MITQQPEYDTKDLLAQQCYDTIIATIRTRATSDWKTIIRGFIGQAYTNGFQHCLGMLSEERPKA
jgi:hypothetical protein